MHTNIWVPPSVGFKEETAVRTAVKEYDPNLDFGRNENTGQWCIFLKHGTSQATSKNDLPILGFDSVPHPDAALRRLHQADALRRGREIMDSIERHNDSIRDGLERETDDAGGQLAETFEWAFRKMGKAPHSKTIITRKD